MTEFPSNSMRDREEKTSPKAQVKPQKQVKRITTGEARRRKKPLATRFKETFFGGGDARGVWGFVMGEVLVPAAKDMIADATTQAVERAVFGESRRGYRPGGWRPAGQSGPVRYNAYSQPSNGAAPWRSGQGQREISRQARSMHNFDEIVLDSRADAEQVLDTLQAVIEEYGTASVADLYQLVGITSAYTDQKYGWTSLQGAKVDHIRGGQHLLNLPKPEPLD